MLKEINRLRPFFSRKDKLLYLGLFVLMIGAAFADVVGVGAVPAFVAMLATPDAVFSYPAAAHVLSSLGITTAQELVLWGCVGLIVVFVLKNAYLTFVYYSQVRLMEHHRVRMGARLFTAYMHAPYEFHLNRNSAELLRNVNIEAHEIFRGVINPLMTAVLGGLITLGITILLVFTTPWIGLVGIAVMAAGSWGFLQVFKKRLTRYGIEAKYERKASIKAVNQGLGALVEARVLGRESYLSSAFVRSLSHFAHVDRLRQVIEKASPPVLETIAVVGLLLVAFVLVLTGMDMAGLVPTLALFGAAIVRLRASISQVVGGISQIQYSITSIANVADDLNALERQQMSASRKSIRGRLPFTKSLVFESVCYTYPGQSAPALKDVTLTIPKGSSVGFVGATGAGKTTLINVLLGLLVPQQGTVSVDDANIYANLRGWHQNVGYIPQTIFLLDDTIRRNVALGLKDEEIAEEKVRAAIRAAQLEDFVNSLEHGVDTTVGERGVRISGGQRQRVGLARALYHNPDVLIMDEGTSSLDNQTENQVMQALHDLKEGRTLIMIAHRLSTVQDCDCLYFLRDGRVNAVGTYDELCTHHPDFRRMAEVV